MSVEKLSLQLLQHLPDAYVIVQVDDGDFNQARVVLTNPVFDQLFNKSHYKTDSHWDFFADYLTPSESNFIKMNLQLNAHCEYKTQVAEFDDTWFSFEFFEIESNADSTFYAGKVRDAHDELHTQQEIKNSNILLQSILDNAVDGIITIDSKGTVRTFNRAAERLFGYDADEVIGNNVSMLMTKRDADDHDQYIGNYVKTGKGKIIGIGREVYGLKKSGEEFPIDLGVSGTNINNESIFIGMTRDLTLQKAYEKNLREEKEKAIQANNSKSKFLANMSHELRTPMHTIMGFVDILLEKMSELPAAKQQQFLMQIRDGSDRLLALINDLLDLNKLEAGFMTYSYESVDLVQLIGKSVLELSEYAAENEITIQQNTQQDCLYVCTCDEARIYQVLINLLSNAIKYSKPGKLVDISLTENNNYMTMKVRDQGIGIPESEHISIFEAFTQSSKTVNTAGGTGLGLAICREIISAHYGQIWLENNPEGGSIFYVSISKHIQPSTINRATE